MEALTCPHCGETISYGSETCQVTSIYGGGSWSVTDTMHYGCAEVYEADSTIAWPNGEVTQPVGS